MSERFPDIEVYVKRPDRKAIEEWLSMHFRDVSTVTSGKTTHYSLTNRDGTPITCLVIDDAAKGGFVSIWFKSDATPWPDDMSCARDAFTFFDTEVRCSTGSWSDVTNEPGWISVSGRGEREITWE